MEVKVKIKSVYGTEKIYPANDKAEAFCEMLQQTTLTRNDIAYIKQLGFEVVVAQDKVTL